MNASGIQSVGIISPGDMGHAVGQALNEHGLETITCLSGRSDRTRALSRKAGFTEVDNLGQLVAEADVILSILVPAQALRAARDVGAAIRACSASSHYVDCNAVSPATAKQMSDAIRDAGGQFSDASIIGFPPGTSDVPRLYVSGPDAQILQALDGKGIIVKRIGDQIGQASGIKMCYAAMTKGTFALQYALTCVAHRLNTLDELIAEFEYSQRDALQRMQQFLPKLPAKSGRWVGEMEQIAATFESVGVSPDFFQGAADVYRLVSQSEFGNETPETIDASRTLEETIAGIVNQVGKFD